MKYLHLLETFPAIRRISSHWKVVECKY